VFSGLRILLARIQPILAGLEFSYHPAFLYVASSF
jgi:hypothetical protein